MVFNNAGIFVGSTNAARPNVQPAQVVQILNHPLVFEPINRCITMYCIFGNWMNIAKGYAALTVRQNRQAFNTVVNMICGPAVADPT